MIGILYDDYTGCKEAGNNDDNHRSRQRQTFKLKLYHGLGENPRALASGLSYIQVDKHGITILYHLYQCRHCTPRDISC